ncbi:MAG: hypothetical protein AAFP84_01165 [Actinomycetota bacterium]
MAAPKFSPVAPTERVRVYESPEHVPDSWTPERPGAIDGFQPTGRRLGAQGPDQGYALKLANQLRDRLHLQPGEHADDVIRGCVGIATRRASLFSRAPVVHDLHVAFTVWGFYDPEPDPDLVALRSARFEGLRHVGHHYAEARAVVDAVDTDAIQRTPDAVEAAYAAGWRELIDV